MCLSLWSLVSAWGIECSGLVSMAQSGGLGLRIELVVELGIGRDWYGDLQGSDAWGVVRWFQSLGWVWLVVGLFFLLAIVVEIVVTLSFEEFTNEK